MISTGLSVVTCRLVHLDLWQIYFHPARSTERTVYLVDGSTNGPKVPRRYPRPPLREWGHRLTLGIGSPVIKFPETSCAEPRFRVFVLLAQGALVCPFGSALMSIPGRSKGTLFGLRTDRYI